MADQSANEDDLRPEYDPAVFQHAVRGKYAERFAAGTNIVRLAPDVAQTFPTEQAVNNALRFLQQFANDASRIVGGSNR
jgi:hypothetical protein